MFEGNHAETPCNIGFPVKHQRAGKRLYVEHGGKLCSRCRKNPPQPGQRICKTCHAEDMRDWRLNTRLNRIDEMRSLVATLRAVTADPHYLDAPKPCIARLINSTEAKIARLERANARLSTQEKPT